ncbi:enoyl-CoA hydratase/isomerase family protein [Mesobacillus zeae]|uniref:Ethylmalonyl-CoA decarboxylase n=1 Tax=Mesobacillus zeae TaxID=1917180 RepID=A0A398BKJ6_9BACI|nr:enoyl-CoA hydratase/isomerase family protein [Mesobacillus zeae]RID87893.1 enoyl-CoA hydratase/isomerase family protein [Mesobacillus zeae]
MDSYTINMESNGILIFTINRPEKRNAVDYKVMDGLLEAIKLCEDDKVKALAVTGTGKAFCSGGDLSIFHGLITAEEARGMLSKMAGILYRLMMLPKPTVAVLNGTAVGGGCELASACDFRIAKRGAKAGFIQAGLGITTGWGGGTILLERLPAPKALSMLADGMILSSEELENIGFIDRVFDGGPANACNAFLENILKKDTDVLKAYKNILIRKWVSSSVKERIEEEVNQCAILWESDAHHQKVAEFFNKK